ncbi:MAG: phosphate-starvation-inducible PsiE family protein [Chlamydiia bacterium]|nr:phosphate-starvation-inducible PsiE family protein [Chlamydiia bacterium]
MDPKEELTFHSQDPLIKFLSHIVSWCVKILACLMVVVIIWATVDVAYHLWVHSTESQDAIFNVERLLQDLGAFLAVMIAIEIFMNIVIFLRSERVHVPLVLATALTAVARKVIIIDYLTISYEIMFAVGAIIAAVGTIFWLVTRNVSSFKS